MELSGHSGEVFCAKFDSNGNYVASGSMDRTISMFVTNMSRRGADLR
jgi:Prp8 binding protein